MRRKRAGRGATAAAVGLLWVSSSALRGQALPPGCEAVGRVAVEGIALGSSYAAARARHRPAPGDVPLRPAADTGRIRYAGRGVYLGVSADTIVSIGLERPSGVELCGVRVGHTRPQVAERWGRPRSQLPSAWIYGDSVGLPARWVAVVYFGGPGGAVPGPADSVARVAVMYGHAP
jgi:hypothetical protein